MTPPSRQRRVRKETTSTVEQPEDAHEQQKGFEQDGRHWVGTLDVADDGRAARALK